MRTEPRQPAHGVTAALAWDGAGSARNSSRDAEGWDALGPLSVTINQNLETGLASATLGGDGAPQR
jgi:hypothetical protein